MSKDNSEYKKSLLPFKKNHNNNPGSKMGGLEDKRPGNSETQKEVTKKKR